MAVVCSVGWTRLPWSGWVIRGKEAALLTALAGELKLEDIALMRQGGPRCGGVPRSRLRRGPGRPGQREPGSGFARTVWAGFGIRSGGPVFLVAAWVAKRVIPGRFLAGAEDPKFHKLNA